MKKIDTQKVSFKIYKDLLDAVSADIKNLPISRDAFLNQLIKVECESLDRELADDPPLTDRQNRYISGKLKELGTHQVNVVLEKTVAERLNEVMKRRNLVRDAFINRLLFLLRAPDGFLRRMRVISEKELPWLINYGPCRVESLDELPAKPLKLIEMILTDPLRFLREQICRIQDFPEVDDRGIRFYRDPMPEKFIGFSCTISDADIPGTDDYKYWHSPVDIEKANAALEQAYAKQTNSQ